MGISFQKSGGQLGFWRSAMSDGVARFNCLPVEPETVGNLLPQAVPAISWMLEPGSTKQKYMDLRGRTSR